MRSRIPSRLLVTAVTATSLVLAAATPTWAGTTRPATVDAIHGPAASSAAGRPVASTGPASPTPSATSSAPDSAPPASPASPAALATPASAAPRPDEDPDREARLTSDPEPADRPGGSTHAATDAEVGLAVEVAKDGTGPFTPQDGPGADADAENGIVRTLDAITYRVTMNSTGGSSEHERFTLTAPTGTSWAAVPGRCDGAGSRISGQDLVCDLGTVAEGHAIAVPAVLDVSGDLRNGDELRVTGVGTADGADAPVSATSPRTTVSAAARYNLSKNVLASTMRTDVRGPGGAKGIQLVYPLAVDWQPIVPGQGLLGFEKAHGPMTFTDDVSQLLGDLPSGARLWNGDRPACGPNTAEVPGFGGLPAGTGGGDRGVADSGTIRCEQDAPGQDVDVTITGTVTDATKMPTENKYGGPIAGGRVGYVVTGYISFWMPTPPAGTNVRSVNRCTPLQVSSTIGAPNFPGGTEPTVDNVSERSIVEFAPGSGGKRLYRVVGDGTAVRPGSARLGDPWTTPGAALRSEVSMHNPGLSRYQDAVLCDTFDRATQRLTEGIGASAAARVTGLSGARVEYAAYEMTSPSDGQQRSCDDSDGPWYDAPDAVPGGIGAVGAVRAVGDLTGGGDAVLHAWVTVADAPDGTRALDFGHLSFGVGHPGWVHDPADPALGVGVLTDSVVITEDLARVAKKIVDRGHDAQDTPDRTSSVVPGESLEYALYPTLTNGNTKGRPTTLTVRDTLPLHTTYVLDSASQTPVIDSVEDPDGGHHQQLRWTFHDVQPNADVAPITYRLRVSSAAPAGPIENAVEVASPADRSDTQYRRAERAVQVIAGGGVGVQESAVDPVVVAGDRLAWRLDYTNTSSEPVHGVDLIDVLPDRTDPDDGSFHGRTTLAGPVAVDPAAGESVTYTAAVPDAVSLDGQDASNQPGGATTWCPESAFGSPGCPSSLGDVTASRITRTAAVGVGDTVTHELALATEGERDGDEYANRFGLRVADLALPVRSNRASIRVVAGAIGDRVWTDEDGDGLQESGEPGLGDVAVRLTGTDDEGTAVDRTTTSDPDGTYRFDTLRPGEYVTTFTAPDGRAFTRALVGDDRAVDSDASEDGTSGTVTLGRETTAEGVLDHVDRTSTVDAGVLPGDDTTDPGDGGPDGPGDGGPDGPGEPGASGGSGTPGGSTGTGGPGVDRPGERPSGSSAHGSHGSTWSGTVGAPARRGDLAFTGAEGLSALLGGALLLLGLGVAVIVVRRRRVRR
ncbi:SdrD B-like domain-containing protein [Curtobacterium aetherium]|uniref:Uncharacterized protein n=1 Tax=Curtobacterium aetherium TaxID=2841594 RepID=A0ACD1E1L1_9MICO|nr:SdrD B-like domain-containing protein [Curtobacterium sp. L6-1]QWS32741.1 hypothetical protein KM842_10685 [Curtobacterium sp. L6-1]